MKRSALILPLICAFMLCGCAEKSAPEPTAAPISTATPEPTAAPEPTPDPRLLGVEAGELSGSYSSQNTGDYLDYWLLIPNNAMKELPLVVFLHGDGQVGQPEQLPESGIVEKTRELYGEDFPFILLLPCTRSYSWIDGTIPETLMELIDTVAADYSVDTEKIILTGHSRGAIGVWRMVSTYGDRFSAAVPISCGSQGAIDGESFTDVPLWGFVGDIDHDYIAGEMSAFVSQVNTAGGSALLTVLPGANHGQTAREAFSEELFEWMLTR